MQQLRAKKDINVATIVTAAFIQSKSVTFVSVSYFSKHRFYGKSQEGIILTLSHFFPRHMRRVIDHTNYIYYFFIFNISNLNIFIHSLLSYRGVQSHLILALLFTCDFNINVTRLQFLSRKIIRFAANDLLIIELQISGGLFCISLLVVAKLYASRRILAIVRLVLRDERSSLIYCLVRETKPAWEHINGKAT